MAREPIPTWYFALVVVRRGDRFLVVHETKHGQKWYLPAGRVEPGETLVAGALRETLEETGIPVAIDGILRIQHTPHPVGTARVRIVFVAHPIDDTPPKVVANEHSLRAAWVTLDELDTLDLRDPEVRVFFQQVSTATSIAPLSLLTFEPIA